MSGENRQRQRWLNVVIALGHFGERAVQHRFGTLLKGGDEREAVLPELGKLQDAFDVDAVPRIGRGDLREDARLVVDREPYVMRRDEVAADVVKGGRERSRGLCLRRRGTPD